jgi:hypothetical protein
MALSDFANFANGWLRHIAPFTSIGTETWGGHAYAGLGGNVLIPLSNSRLMGRMRQKPKSNAVEMLKSTRYERSHVYHDLIFLRTPCSAISRNALIQTHA